VQGATSDLKSDRRPAKSGAWIPYKKPRIVGQGIGGGFLIQEIERTVHGKATKPQQRHMRSGGTESKVKKRKHHNEKQPSEIPSTAQPLATYALPRGSRVGLGALVRGCKCQRARTGGAGTDKKNQRRKKSGKLKGGKKVRVNKGLESD